MTIFGREPVRAIGIIVTVVLALVTTLLGQGVISDALAGRITDIVHAIEQILLLLAPIITAELARPQVTPVGAPKLPAGTPVLIDNPPGVPDDVPSSDAVVAPVTMLKGSPPAPPAT